MKKISASLDTVKRARAILDKRDRKRLALMTGFQIFIGLFDVYGIAMIGAIGALAIQIVESRPAGNKVKFLLKLLHLQNFALTTDVAILAAIAGSVLLAKSIISIYVQRKIFRFLSFRGARLSSDLLRKVLSQDLTDLQKTPSQQILTTVTTSVKDLLLGLLGTFSSLISDLSLLVLILVSLVLYDPLTALFLAVLFGSLVFVLQKLLSKKARENGHQITTRTISNDSRILEVLQSYREAVVRNRRGYYAQEVEGLQHELAGYQADAQFMPFISKYVLESFSIISALSLAGVEFATKNGVYGFASLGIFYAAATRISTAALRVQQELLFLRQTEASANLTLNLVDKLRHLPVIAESSKNFDFTHEGFAGSIEIKDLAFSYSDQNNFALKDVNISVKAGESIAFVGPSGAGKTTLVDLILGVLKPDAGSIKISGLDPREAAGKWSGAISYVPQNVVITNSTIRKNVCLGYPMETASDEKVWEALEIAQLAEQVRAMPEGLDTPVGEFGSALSGGQRQRLGIARAMFTNPGLLVLDEASSALDAQTESDLTKAINNLSGKVTVVVVAHRLSTIRNVDQLIYLEKGKILGVGNFEELKSKVPNFNNQTELMGLN